MQSRLNVAATFSVMCFNGNNGSGGIHLCRALFALSPAPASRNNESRCIGKDHLTWFWMFHFVLTENGVALCSCCKMHSDGSLQGTSIKHSSRKRITDADQIAKI